MVWFTWVLIAWKFVALVWVGLKPVVLVFRLPNGVGGVVIGEFLGEIGGEAGEFLAVGGFVVILPASAWVVGDEGCAVAVFALPCGGDVGGGG